MALSSKTELQNVREQQPEIIEVNTLKVFIGTSSELYVTSKIWIVNKIKKNKST